jgi:DNA-directed RNA polymerase
MHRAQNLPPRVRRWKKKKRLLYVQPENRNKARTGNLTTEMPQRQLTGNLVRGVYQSKEDILPTLGLQSFWTSLRSQGYWWSKVRSLRFDSGTYFLTQNVLLRWMNLKTSSAIQLLEFLFQMNSYGGL